MFYAPGYVVRDVVRNQATYCSRTCKHEAMRGRPVVPFGTKHVRRDGYVYVRVGIRKFELEHRLVIERTLGRELDTDEQVHHLNGDKQDNRIENLVVLTNSEHHKLHARERAAAR